LSGKDIQKDQHQEAQWILFEEPYTLSDPGITFFG